MPDQREDDHVPPIKVMRKRLNGVYRADAGFSGPTRRYVLIVAMLVGLASVPTLAARSGYGSRRYSASRSRRRLPASCVSMAFHSLTIPPSPAVSGATYLGGSAGGGGDWGGMGGNGGGVPTGG